VTADGAPEAAHGMASALDAGDVSSAELVERALERLEAWQPATNAFSQVWSSQAAAWAGEADRSRTGGFAGVPIAVKDLYDVEGFETTGCSRIYEGRVAERDAPTIRRVRGAGMVMIGKTNQHELAFGGTNEYSACGRAGNPWDPRRMTGGSSGGSAAAVAAGVVPWALGSDTGGSIRIPASFCGVFGLKVTNGSIPIDGMLPLAPSMDTPGPLAATAADLGALYRVLAGLPAAPAAAVDDGRGVRLGVLGGYFATHVHRDAARTVQAVAAAFERAGATVEPVAGDGLLEARGVWRRICSTEFVAAHPAVLERRGELLDPDIADSIDLALGGSPQDLALASERRASIGRVFRALLASGPFDALLVPTTGYAAPPPAALRLPAWPSGAIDLERIKPGWFTSAVNLAGLPAVSLPAGTSEEGLPIGASLIGVDRAEERLVALAALWEAATAYRPARPSLPGPLDRPRG
jgi:Asp-tRNA(Asn)/Glu-tRNA(Gln) amidotransferase A subunit family amidase